MAITNFMSLTAEECGAFYPIAKSNALRHLRAAKMLYVFGDKANAIAHRILGTEEMVKALLLFLEGKGMELRSINAIKPLFRHHVPRHKLFKTFFTSLHAMHTISVASSLPFGKAIAKLLLGALEAYSNVGWWERAEKTKQKAFYADHDNGVYNDPSKLTEQDYRAAYAYTRAVNLRMMDVIDYVSKMNSQELVWFKESFHTAQFPELLAETLKKK